MSSITSGSSNSSRFPSIVPLNVGGRIFYTSLQTLRHTPGSFLGILFSDETTFPPSQDEKGRYFIDRDGTHFHYILNYLRDGSVDLPSDSLTRKQIAREAMFYQIEGLLQVLGVLPSKCHKDMPSSTTTTTTTTTTKANSNSVVSPPSSPPSTTPTTSTTSTPSKSVTELVNQTLQGIDFGSLTSESLKLEIQKVFCECRNEPSGLSPVGGNDKVLTLEELEDDLYYAVKRDCFQSSLTTGKSMTFAGSKAYSVKNKQQFNPLVFHHLREKLLIDGFNFWFKLDNFVGSVKWSGSVMNMSPNEIAAEINLACMSNQYSY